MNVTKKDIFSLNTYITPTIQIPNEDNKLYVRRDDLLPFSFGGNKVRIALEFISDMYEKGMDCIVGYGNARSNLSRALANLCYQCGVPCHIISPADEDGSRTDTFNSKIAQACNAEFHYCSKQNVKETIENVIEELKEEGLDPYYIYGDSTGKGNEYIPLRAYQKVYEEIKKGGEYDYIFLATGTGMTQGGLVVGKALCVGNEKIVGISVARSAEQEKKVIRDMIESYSRNIQQINVDEIIVSDSYLCNGYGTYNRYIEKTINEQMICNGIPLDPTYTGKAFWGMQDYLRNNHIEGKKVLFIHTGGTPLFFDYENGKRLY